MRIVSRTLNEYSSAGILFLCANTECFECRHGRNELTSSFTGSIDIDRREITTIIFPVQDIAEFHRHEILSINRLDKGINKLDTEII